MATTMQQQDVERLTEKLEEVYNFVSTTGAGATQHDAAAAAMEALRIVKAQAPDLKPRSEANGARHLQTDAFGTLRCGTCNAAEFKMRSVGAYFDLSCSLGHTVVGEPGKIITVGIDEVVGTP